MSLVLTPGVSDQLSETGYRQNLHLAGSRKFQHFDSSTNSPSSVEAEANSVHPMALI